MSNMRHFDFGSSTNARFLSLGPNYGITNIASLPEEFTNDFTKVDIEDGVQYISPQRTMADTLYASIQVFIATKSAAITSCTFKLQGSNIGGTASGVWSDISGASVTPTDVGSYIINLPASLKSTLYLRVVADVEDADLECYLVGLGYKNI